jgi:hypothetical protein
MTHHEKDWADILDTCIERLNKGESIDNIIADYPQQADDLRTYLQMGQAIGDLPVDDQALQGARQRTRDAMLDALDRRDTKRKVRPFPWGRALMVASIMLIVGVGVGRIINGVLFAPIGAVFDDITMALDTSESAVERPEDADGVGSSGDSAPIVATSVADLRAVTSTPMPSMMPPPTSMPSALPPMTATRNAEVSLALTPTARGLGAASTSVPSSADGSYGDSSIGSDYFSSRGGTAVYVTATPVPTLDMQNFQLQPLQAGERDDNAEWDEYLLYRRNFLASVYADQVYDVDVSRRIQLRVVDEQERPILGALVEVSVQGESIVRVRTFADGTTHFFPDDSTRTYELRISKGDAVLETTIDRADSVPIFTLSMSEQGE